MEPTVKTPTGALVAAIVLGVVALAFWLLSVALLSDLAVSDPAGNAYAQAYAAFGIIVLWLLLAVIAIIASAKGAMPKPAALAALVLIPASGFVTMVALELLSRPQESPYLWPLVIPVGVPPLVYAFCLWSLIPRLNAAIPARFAAGFVWGIVAILCLTIVPLDQMRANFRDQEAAKIQKYDADFAAMPADAPLWDWVPFLNTRNSTKQSEVLDRISKLNRRQSDTETMLERGDFPIQFLGRIDLTPTQSICDKARALLRRQALSLMLKTPNSAPYLTIFIPANNAIAAMRWLVGHNCSCDAESQAWQTTGESYRDPGFDMVELRELRDPKELGRQQRNNPERFSMLTPKSHLRAWLKFAEDTYTSDKTTNEQALAGARKLDHRTADAVEMLREGEYSGWTVLKYLPVLDLEATPSLCGYALTAVNRDVSKVYRPTPDNPLPYSELLERLGIYQPLTALVWLAGHGCEAEPELSEAEEVIRTYQGTAGRAAMLATLAKLHRK